MADKASIDAISNPSEIAVKSGLGDILWKNAFCP